MDKQQIAEWYHKYVTVTNEGRDGIYFNTVDMLSDFASEFVPQQKDEPLLVSAYTDLTNGHNKIAKSELKTDDYGYCMRRLVEVKMFIQNYLNPLPPPPTK